MKCSQCQSEAAEGKKMCEEHLKKARDAYHAKKGTNGTPTRRKAVIARPLDLPAPIHAIAKDGNILLILDAAIQRALDDVTTLQRAKEILQAVQS